MVDTLFLIYIGALGAIIGSFLNVVLIRFNTGASINGRSHCLSCGTTLSWRELFPILSYVVQRGRCRHCSSLVSIRYVVVEVVTALLFIYAWIESGGDILTFFLLSALLSVLVFVFFYDIRHLIIPNSAVLALLGITILFLGYQYLEGLIGVEEILLQVGSGIISGGFFALLWLISRGRWIGLGDAKLVLPLGILVPLSSVFSMVVLSFWIGAGVSLLVILLMHVRGKRFLRFFPHRITMKKEIPFAPFLITAFLLVYFMNVDVFHLSDVLLSLVY